MISLAARTSATSYPGSCVDHGRAPAATVPPWPVGLPASLRSSLMSATQVLGDARLQAVLAALATAPIEEPLRAPMAVLGPMPDV